MSDAQVHIREARQEDADAIRALTREAYAKWVPVIGREPMPMGVDYAEAVKKHRFDLLYMGDDLAALIQTARDSDWLMIENVAVHPSFQNRGFGRRLLALAEELAAEANLIGTRLYTNQKMETNIRLYLSLGYRIDSEEENMRGVRVNMSKRL